MHVCIGHFAPASCNCRGDKIVIDRHTFSCIKMSVEASSTCPLDWRGHWDDTIRRQSSHSLLDCAAGSKTLQVMLHHVVQQGQVCRFSQSRAGVAATDQASPTVSTAKMTSCAHGHAAWQFSGFFIYLNLEQVARSQCRHNMPIFCHLPVDDVHASSLASVLCTTSGEHIMTLQ